MACFFPLLTLFFFFFSRPLLFRSLEQQWLKNLYTAEDVKDHICKLARKGVPPSKIGESA